MRSALEVIDVGRFINERPFGPFQRRLVIYGVLLCMLDGFDVQSIAFVAPAIASLWHLPPAALGPVFAAGLFGLMIGALVAGPLADRIGRKPVLLGAVFFFGVCSIATALASSSGSLAVLRFATGLGLGGALPNLITITAEYAPERLRATVITVVFCGFPLGAVLGGLGSTVLIPWLGWQSVFYLGGLLPLLIAIFLWKRLPESARFLVSRGHPPQDVRRVLQRVAPDLSFDSSSTFKVDVEAGVGRQPLSLLFHDGRAPITLLLWLVFFMNLLTLYFLINWLPTLFARTGLPLRQAIISAVIMNAGGIVGSFALGRAVDRIGARRVLIAVSAAAGALIAAAGVWVGESAVLGVIVFLTGGCVIGGQIALNALAASLYPTAARATGVGWALGVGRLGSVVGPLVGGLLLRADAQLGDIMSVCAVAPLIAALALYFLRTPETPHRSESA
jgi:AAHS family 4-hydroxybenzoate transporter-like MFS transporter